MGRYKALVSFAGLVTGAKGQTINIEDDAVARDLLRAKYIQAVDNTDQAPTPAKSPRRRKTKTVEG